MTWPSWQPGRWWRVLDPQGGLRCETSDEEEARENVRAGDRLERLYVRTESRWISARPNDEESAVEVVPGHAGGSDS